MSGQEMNRIYLTQELKPKATYIMKELNQANETLLVLRQTSYFDLSNSTVKRCTAFYRASSSRQISTMYLQNCNKNRRKRQKMTTYLKIIFVLIIIVIVICLLWLTLYTQYVIIFQTGLCNSTCLKTALCYATEKDTFHCRESRCAHRCYLRRHIIPSYLAIIHAS